MSTRNTAAVVVRRHPDDAFAVITDIDRLPEWNDLITVVVESPAALRPGAVWKVALAQGPLRWVSRSTVTAYDPAQRRFAHRSGTDDDNPSFALWTWQVEPHPEGCRITVSWSLRPRTRIRRWVLAPFRARRLRSEVPASLERLRAVLERDGAEPDGAPRSVVTPPTEAYS